MTTVFRSYSLRVQTSKSIAYIVAYKYNTSTSTYIFGSLYIDNPLESYIQISQLIPAGGDWLKEQVDVYEDGTDKNIWGRLVSVNDWYQITCLISGQCDCTANGLKCNITDVNFSCQLSCLGLNPKPYRCMSISIHHCILFIMIDQIESIQILSALVRTSTSLFNSESSRYSISAAEMFQLQYEARI